MDEIVMGVQGPCPSGSAGAFELVVCSSSVAPPITFGGAFLTHDVAEPPCGTGNPRADGDCACPPGFADQSLRIINTVDGFGGSVHVCVAEP
jgi:hypothetical protein